MRYAIQQLNQIQIPRRGFAEGMIARFYTSLLVEGPSFAAKLACAHDVDKASARSFYRMIHAVDGPIEKPDGKLAPSSLRSSISATRSNARKANRCTMRS